jgi:hypothetical protein
VQIFNAPEERPGEPDPNEPDPLSRFRTWRGFLLATIVLNVLFVYGMMGSVKDPSTAVWTKALSWFPFNVIGSVLYLVLLRKLSQADSDCAQAAGGADKAGTYGALYVVLCIAMIIANWIALFAA